MLLLALDTSTRLASIALCTEQTLIAEYTWQVGNNHSVELLASIRRLCAESGTRLQACDAIAVATGPGSFNGLRVAVATAKTLAFALRKPLLGIGTLDILAAQQAHWPGPICPLLEAGRGEVYAACYAWQHRTGASPVPTMTGGDLQRLSGDDRPGTSLVPPTIEGDKRLQRLSDYVLLTPAELASFLHTHAGAWFGVPGERALPIFLFCGEMSATTHTALQDALPAPGAFAPGLQSVRHASLLALLAQQRLSEGSADDPLLLEPFYLRRPSITTSLRKQPLLGNKTDPGPAESESDTINCPTNKQEREKGAVRH